MSANFDFSCVTSIRSHITEDCYTNVDNNVKCYISKILIDCQEACKLQNNRDNVPKDVFHVLEELLGCDNGLFVSSVITLTHCYRLLRNMCAGSLQNQNALVSTKIFHLTQELVTHLNKKILSGEICDEVKDQDITCLRCAVQFLGNSATGHDLNKVTIWNSFVHCFCDLLKIKDETLSKYTCMVIYTCAQHPENTKQLLNTESGRQILVTVISCLTEFNIEWCMYLIEHLLQEENFLQFVYRSLDHTQMSLISELVLSKLKENEGGSKSENLCVSEGNADFITEMFINDAYVILGLHKDQNESMQEEQLQPVLVRNALDCLCIVTSWTHCYTRLKSDSRLLTVVINLLHCMKALGQQADSVFSEASKIDDSAIVDIMDPVYGMKSQLIRIVSNMCYKNRANQDLVRDLNGITLLMDHTNIDAKNPFVTQWAVFAIRNLCDKNMENQAVIAGLKLEGLSDKVDELRKYGVKAEIEGDKVVIKQVPENSDDDTQDQGKQSY